MSALKRGDIVAAKRIGYYHFAVYIGNRRVIHYASETGDFGGKITVHEAPFEEFQRDSDEVYVLEFPESRGKPQYQKVNIGSLFGGKSFAGGSVVGNPLPDFGVTVALGRVIAELIRNNEYHVYSAEETVRRAKSKLGEEKYSLPFNNCEHFAIWCKTGVKESWQVDEMVEELLRIAAPIPDLRKY